MLSLTQANRISSLPNGTKLRALTVHEQCGRVMESIATADPPVSQRVHAADPQPFTKACPQHGPPMPFPMVTDILCSPGCLRFLPGEEQQEQHLQARLDKTYSHQQENCDSPR